MELREFINVVRARRWIIIQAALIVALTAVVVSYLQPKTYVGTAEVLISERDTAADDSKKVRHPRRIRIDGVEIFHPHH